MIELNLFQSSIGCLSILALKEGVVKISFANESIEVLENWCHSHLGKGVVKGTTFTITAQEQIIDYLIGKRKSLDFPVLHHNSSFRKYVLETERKIPYGETRSYGEVAHMVNNPKAYRAVGSANAENPLPIYFPCHRIINSNGKLGGYGGGLKVKEFLLKIERESISQD